MGKNIKQMIEYPHEGILSKEIIKNEKIDVGLFCMAKGMEMSEHTSSKQGYIHVIEGQGKFILEGEEIDMVPGVFIFLEKEAKHSLKAEENTAFILCLIE